MPCKRTARIITHGFFGNQHARQLVEMGYGGYVNLEYEIDASDPLPGMLRSFAYMRGVIDGLGLVEG